MLKKMTYPRFESGQPVKTALARSRSEFCGNSLICLPVRCLVPVEAIRMVGVRLDGVLMIQALIHRLV